MFPTVWVSPGSLAAQEPPAHTASINGWVALDDGQLPRLQFAADDKGRLTHQVFRFPAKFHAPVVRQLISTYSKPGERLLDNFCGSGTLMVEASISSRHAVGFDVDPLSVFVAQTKSQPIDCEALTVAAQELLDTLSGLSRGVEEYRQRAKITEDLTEEEFTAQSAGLAMPAIPRLAFWFRRYVLVDLARLRDAIEAIDTTEPLRDVLRLVFASIIRAASNADPVPVSGLERTKHIRARDELGRLIDPFALYERKLQRTIKDIKAYQALRSEASVCRVAIADATQRLPLQDGERVHAVITSPPYHGAVDYYRRHQLEMFWLGLTADQPARLRLLDQYLGRPHVPQKHRFVLNTDLAAYPQAARCEAAMRIEAPRRADEFRHYCVGMARAFARLADVLAVGAPAIFIVGRSRWNGHSLDTSRLLAELARPAFDLDKELWYPVKNRHMSYGRRNGANIDREFVLVFRRTTTG